MVGPSGRELNRVLLDAGLVREKLLLIYAVACLPTEPRKPKDMRRAVICCQPLFWSQLKGLPPDIPTLACGKWAYYSMTGKDKGVMKARGFLYGKFRLEPPHGYEQEVTTSDDEISTEEI